MPVLARILVPVVLVGLIALGVVYSMKLTTDLQRHDLTGSITVYDDDPSRSAGRYVQGSNGEWDYAYNFRQGMTCSGAAISSGYSDMTAGAQVVVKDEEGAIIATGSLGAGSWRNKSECVLPLSVRRVPAAKFYSIEVSNRGEQRYSAEDLADRSYEINLTLGN